MWGMQRDQGGAGFCNAPAGFPSFYEKKARIWVLLVNKQPFQTSGGVPSQNKRSQKEPPGNFTTAPFKLTEVSAE